MERREVAKRAAVAVIVFLVGVAPWAVPAPGAALDPGFERADAGEYHPDEVLVRPPTPEGDPALDVQRRGKHILVDTEHGNAFSDADIYPLVSALQRRGHEVTYYNVDTAAPGGLSEALDDADAFVVISPRDRFEVPEARAVESFVDDGGRLLLVGGPTAQPIGPFGSRGTGVTGHADFAARFGVTFGQGYLYNMRANQHNFRSIYAEPTRDDPVVAGIDRVVMRSATPVHVYNGRVILRGVPGTQLSTTRDRGLYPVAARRGNVLAVGDPSVFYPENAAVADNEVLVGNVGDFLVGGERAPEPSSGTPTASNATATPTPG